MGGNDWSVAIDMIREQFENAYNADKHTVFDGPVGTLAPLPQALGGDLKQLPALAAAAANSKTSFFKLLQAKARYLMLPKSIIAALDDSWRVNLSEESSGEKMTDADTLQYTLPPRRAEMRIPGASEGLAKAGYGLARNDFAEDPSGYCAMLARIYHEMTHAWLWLQEFYDADLQALWANGVIAYLHASGADGTDFSDQPGNAFSEAAAYYVQDRIERWCTALYGLDALLRVKPADPKELTTRLQKIVDDYNQYNEVERAYGWVNFEPITSPTLSFTLRDAINKKVLDGLPLTKAFADTPLADLHDALAPPP